MSTGSPRLRLLPPLAAAVVTMATGCIAAAQSVKVTGVVRDFRTSHPDFNVVPTSGLGHYAGNVQAQIGSTVQPSFTGDGFKVNSEWRDSSARPIPPHLAAPEPGSIPVAVPTPGPALGTLDSWDSTAGPYGPPNVGPAPPFDVGAPMPDVAVPLSLMHLPNQGDVTLSVTSTLDADLHCDELNVSGILQIDGQVSILCEEPLLLDTWTEIVLLPGASLRMYLLDGSATWNHASVNANTGDPSLVTIYNLSTDPLMFHNHSQVYARVISPDAALELENHGALYGSFVGQTIDFGNHGDFHADTAPPVDACDVLIDDDPGVAGPDDPGGITSAETFSHWYRDVLGQNLSARHVIRLADVGGGVYEYADDSFFPIDGLLFGNEGDPHNYFFTFALDLRFTYHACTGQFLELAGADDIWAFVDGALAIDLGGVLAGTEQHLQLDRLDLVDGRTYTLHLLFAHRHPGASRLHLRTNVELETGHAFTASAPAD